MVISVVYNDLARGHARHFLLRPIHPRLDDHPRAFLLCTIPWNTESIENEMRNARIQDLTGLDPHASSPRNLSLGLSQRVPVSLTLNPVFA